MLLSFVAVLANRRSKLTIASHPSAFAKSRTSAKSMPPTVQSRALAVSAASSKVTLARPAKGPNALATSTDVKPYTLRNTHSVS